ncbi:uncharacterized protein LOC118182007 [Stegodyphus dumicola]|uniref:uncharacterized protein LOC118182007 n=1 Tax=Stegodyphus dumicola TaxID=202533 RepID=UPI0015B35210|nr:uncharacterized protein LOC118182007 [Stegodyphus dumicola]
MVFHEFLESGGNAMDWENNEINEEDPEEALLELNRMLRNRPLTSYRGFLAKYEKLKASLQSFCGSLPPGNTDLASGDTDPVSDAYTCYALNIQDSNLVSACLSRVFEMNGHFLHLLFRFTQRNQDEDVPFFVESMFCGLYQEPSKFSAIHYFIEHANRTRLTFEQGKHFLDQVWEDCIAEMTILEVIDYLKNPQLLLFLARHGVDIVRINATSQILGHVLKDVLLDISLNILKILDVRHIREYRKARYWQRIHRKAAMLQIVLLTIPYADFYFAEQQLARFNIPLTNIVRLVGRYHVLPALFNRFKQPPPLKHLSRCAVRGLLHSNFQLPRGIFDLPIEDDLKTYLDLMLD